MADITYREYRPEDAESFLQLHDSCFPPMSVDFWREWSEGPVTATVAELDGAIVGTVPFHFRDLRVRPDAAVRVAWEFSVCVREDLRGKGIGSRLMDTAKSILPGRCAAMLVYRNDELSPAYHFYARNGHQDLLYARPWTWRGRPVYSGSLAHVQVRTWEEFLADEEEHLHVFASAYSASGGYPQRHPGYYGPAVSTSEYDEIPVALSVFDVRDDRGRLDGYAIVGEEQGSSTLHLMEIAARANDEAVALRLLSACCQHASDRGVRAVASVADSSPYVGLLRALDFQPALRSESSMVTMAYVLDAEGLARAVWREGEATAGLEVVAWTPKREVLLHRARRDPATRVVLEMKESTLTRLLFSRLDLREAVDEERVTSVGAGAAEIASVGQALPYTTWAYHYLDFV